MTSSCSDMRIYEKGFMFLGDFIQKVLGLPPLSAGLPETRILLTKFLSDYRPIKDSSDKVFKNIEEITLPLSATFKSTFPDQHNPNGLIPDNSFIHKGFKTAFGLTYSEFRAKRHSIIALSQRPIIDSKMIELNFTRTIN